MIQAQLFYQCEAQGTIIVAQAINSACDSGSEITTSGECETALQTINGQNVNVQYEWADSTNDPDLLPNCFWFLDPVNSTMKIGFNSNETGPNQQTTGGICSIAEPSGTPCDSTNLCTTGYTCTNAYCVADTTSSSSGTGASGDSCSIDTDCTSGLECTNSYCTAVVSGQVTQGGSCFNNSECTSPLECAGATASIAGSCQTPSDGVTDGDTSSAYMAQNVNTPCTSGTEITDAATCQTAALSLSFTWTETITDANEPPNCFFEQGDNMLVMFNNDASGSFQSTSGGVCTLAVSSGADSSSCGNSSCTVDQTCVDSVCKASYITATNATCPSDHVITSLQSCQQAIELLTAVSDTTAEAYTSASHPKGCYENGSGEVKYNDSYPGTADSSSKAICLAQACSIDADCGNSSCSASYYCESSSSGTGALGDSCSISTDCASGLECTNSYCTAVVSGQVAQGGSCFDTSECASGLECAGATASIAGSCQTPDGDASTSCSTNSDCGALAYHYCDVAAQSPICVEGCQNNDGCDSDQTCTSDYTCTCLSTDMDPTCGGSSCSSDQTCVNNGGLTCVQNGTVFQTAENAECPCQYKINSETTCTAAAAQIASASFGSSEDVNNYPSGCYLDNMTTPLTIKYNQASIGSAQTYSKGICLVGCGGALCSSDQTCVNDVCVTDSTVSQTNSGNSSTTVCLTKEDKTCPEGQMITSETDCTAAISDYTSSTLTAAADFSGSYSSGFPPGCVKGTSNDIVYFNSRTDITYESTDWQGLCRAPDVTSTNYFQADGATPCSSDENQMITTFEDCRTAFNAIGLPCYTFREDSSINEPAYIPGCMYSTYTQEILFNNDLTAVVAPASTHLAGLCIQSSSSNNPSESAPTQCTENSHCSADQICFNNACKETCLDNQADLFTLYNISDSKIKITGLNQSDNCITYDAFYFYDNSSTLEICPASAYQYCTIGLNANQVTQYIGSSSDGAQTTIESSTYNSFSQDQQGKAFFKLFLDDNGEAVYVYWPESETLFANTSFTQTFQISATQVQMQQAELQTLRNSIQDSTQNPLTVITAFAGSQMSFDSTSTCNTIYTMANVYTDNYLTDENISESDFYADYSIALIFDEDYSVVSGSSATFTQTFDTCLTKFEILSEYTAPTLSGQSDPSARQQKISLEGTFSISGYKFKVRTDPLTVVTTAQNQDVFLHATEGEACDVTHMITTLEDCQAAKDVFADGGNNSQPVTEVNSASRHPGCVNALDNDDEISFNSDFSGTESGTTNTGLCRTNMTVNGCIDDFDCTSSVAHYCVSGLCASTKSCTNDNQCMKSGFCDIGGTDVCAECTGDGCSGKYYHKDLGSSCPQNDIIQYSADCAAAATFYSLTASSDTSASNRDFGCFHKDNAIKFNTLVDSFNNGAGGVCKVDAKTTGNRYYLASDNMRCSENDTIDTSSDTTLCELAVKALSSTTSLTLNWQDSGMDNPNQPPGCVKTTTGSYVKYNNSSLFVSNGNEDHTGICFGSEMPTCFSTNMAKLTITPSTSDNSVLLIGTAINSSGIECLAHDSVFYHAGTFDLCDSSQYSSCTIEDDGSTATFKGYPSGSNTSQAITPSSTTLAYSGTSFLSTSGLSDDGLLNQLSSENLDLSSRLFTSGSYTLTFTAQLLVPDTVRTDISLGATVGFTGAAVQVSGSGTCTIYNLVKAAMNNGLSLTETEFYASASLITEIYYSSNPSTVTDRITFSQTRNGDNDCSTTFTITGNHDSSDNDAVIMKIQFVVGGKSLTFETETLTTIVQCTTDAGCTTSGQRCASNEQCTNLCLSNESSADKWTFIDLNDGKAMVQGESAASYCRAFEAIFYFVEADGFALCDFNSYASCEIEIDVSNVSSPQLTTFQGVSTTGSQTDLASSASSTSSFTVLSLFKLDFTGGTETFVAQETTTLFSGVQYSGADITKTFTMSAIDVTELRTDVGLTDQITYSGGGQTFDSTSCSSIYNIVNTITANSLTSTFSATDFHASTVLDSDWYLYFSDDDTIVDRGQIQFANQNSASYCSTTITIYGNYETNTGRSATPQQIKLKIKYTIDSKTFSFFTSDVTEITYDPNACSDDFTCTDSAAPYCVSGSCSNSKFCSAGNECKKSGYCDSSTGYCAACPSDQDCSGLYYMVDYLASCTSVDDIIQTSSDCTAAATFYSIANNSNDQTDSSRDFGCFHNQGTNSRFNSVDGTFSAGTVGGFCKKDARTSGDRFYLADNNMRCSATDTIDTSSDTTQCELALEALNSTTSLTLVYFGSVTQNPNQPLGCSKQTSGSEVKYNNSSLFVSNGNEDHTGICFGSELPTCFSTNTAKLTITPSTTDNSVLLVGTATNSIGIQCLTHDSVFYHSGTFDFCDSSQYSSCTVEDYGSNATFKGYPIDSITSQAITPSSTTLEFTGTSFLSTSGLTDGGLLNQQSSDSLTLSFASGAQTLTFTAPLLVLDDVRAATWDPINLGTRVDRNGGAGRTINGTGTCTIYNLVNEAMNSGLSMSEADFYTSSSLTTEIYLATNTNTVFTKVTFAQTRNGDNDCNSTFEISSTHNSVDNGAVIMKIQFEEGGKSMTFETETLTTIVDCVTDSDCTTNGQTCNTFGTCTDACLGDTIEKLTITPSSTNSVLLIGTANQSSSSTECLALDAIYYHNGDFDLCDSATYSYCTIENDSGAAIFNGYPSGSTTPETIDASSLTFINSGNSFLSAYDFNTNGLLNQLSDYNAAAKEIFTNIDFSGQTQTLSFAAPVLLLNTVRAVVQLDATVIFTGSETSPLTSSGSGTCTIYELVKAAMNDGLSLTEDQFYTAVSTSLILNNDFSATLTDVTFTQTRTGTNACDSVFEINPSQTDRGTVRMQISFVMDGKVKLFHTEDLTKIIQCSTDAECSVQREFCTSSGTCAAACDGSINSGSIDSLNYWTITNSLSGQAIIKGEDTTNDCIDYQAILNYETTSTSFDLCPSTYTHCQITIDILNNSLLSYTGTASGGSATDLSTTSQSAPYSVLSFFTITDQEQGGVNKYTGQTSEQTLFSGITDSSGNSLTKTFQVATIDVTALRSELSLSASVTFAANGTKTFDSSTYSSIVNIVNGIHAETITESDLCSNIKPCNIVFTANKSNVSNSGASFDFDTSNSCSMEMQIKDDYILETFFSSNANTDPHEISLRFVHKTDTKTKYIVYIPLTEITYDPDYCVDDSDCTDQTCNSSGKCTDLCTSSAVEKLTITPSSHNTVYLVGVANVGNSATECRALDAVYYHDGTSFDLCDSAHYSYCTIEFVLGASGALGAIGAVQYQGIQSDSSITDLDASSLTLANTGTAFLSASDIFTTSNLQNQISNQDDSATNILTLDFNSDGTDQNLSFAAPVLDLDDVRGVISLGTSVIYTDGNIVDLTEASSACTIYDTVSAAMNTGGLTLNQHDFYNSASLSTDLFFSDPDTAIPTVTFQQTWTSDGICDSTFTIDSSHDQNTKGAVRMKISFEMDGKAKLFHTEDLTTIVQCTTDSECATDNYTCTSSGTCTDFSIWSAYVNLANSWTITNSATGQVRIRGEDTIIYDCLVFDAIYNFDAASTSLDLCPITYTHCQITLDSIFYELTSYTGIDSNGLVTDLTGTIASQADTYTGLSFFTLLSNTNSSNQISKFEGLDQHTLFSGFTYFDASFAKTFQTTTIDLSDLRDDLSLSETTTYNAQSTKTYTSSVCNRIYSIVSSLHHDDIQETDFYSSPLLESTNFVFTNDKTQVNDATNIRLEFTEVNPGSSCSTEMQIHDLYTTASFPSSGVPTTPHSVGLRIQYMIGLTQKFIVYTPGLTTITYDANYCETDFECSGDDYHCDNTNLCNQLKACSDGSDCMKTGFCNAQNVCAICGNDFSDYCAGNVYLQDAAEVCDASDVIQTAEVCQAASEFLFGTSNYAGTLSDNFRKPGCSYTQSGTQSNFETDFNTADGNFDLNGNIGALCQVGAALPCFSTPYDKVEITLDASTQLTSIKTYSQSSQVINNLRTTADQALIDFMCPSFSNIPKVILEFEKGTDCAVKTISCFPSATNSDSQDENIEMLGFYGGMPASEIPIYDIIPDDTTDYVAIIASTFTLFENFTDKQSSSLNRIYTVEEWVDPTEEAVETIDCTIQEWQEPDLSTIEDLLIALDEEFSLQLPTELMLDSDGVSYSETCTEIKPAIIISNQPSFVSVSENGLLEIQPTGYDVIGKHTFVIIQTEANGLLENTRESEVTITVTCEGECLEGANPYFAESLLTAFIKVIGEGWSYTLPSTADPLSGTVTVNVSSEPDMGTLLKYDSETSQIAILAGDSNETTGIYVITVDLSTDASDQVRQYKILLSINPVEKVEEVTDDATDDAETSTDSGSKTGQENVPEEISNWGDEIAAMLLEQEGSGYEVKLIEEEPQIYVSEVSQSGNIKLEFSQKMLIPNKKLAGDSFLDFYLVNSYGDITPGIYVESESKARRLEESSVLSFTWETVVFEEKALEFKLNFANPLEVSPDLRNTDQLEIKFKQSNILMSAESQKFIAPELQLQMSIPQQFKDEEQAAQAEAVKEAMQAAVGINLVLLIALQILTGQAIKFLWPLYNVIQLFICFYDMQLPMPVNVRLVIGNIKDALQLNAIPKDDIKEFVVTQPWIENIMNSGGIMILIGAPLLVLVIVLLVCIKKLSKTNKKVQDQLKKIEDKLFFNAIIRSVLIGYLPLAMSSNIGRQLSVNEGNAAGPNFPMVLFQIGVIILSLQASIYADPTELSDPKIKAKYGSFYDTVKYHKLSSMIFNSLFMIRRTLLVVCVQMDISSYRLGLLLFLQLAWIAYLVLDRPIEDNVIMNVEIANEVVFYLFLFVTPLYTPLMTTAQERYDLGFITIGLMGILVMQNLGAVFYKLITQWLEKRKLKKEEAELEAAKKAGLYLMDDDQEPKEREKCISCVQDSSDSDSDEMVADDMITRKKLDHIVFGKICTCEFQPPINTYVPHAVHQVIKQKQKLNQEFSNLLKDFEEKPKDENILEISEEHNSIQQETDIWKILRAKLVLWGFIMKLNQDEEDYIEWFSEEKWNRYRSSAIKQRTKWQERILPKIGHTLVFPTQKLRSAMKMRKDHTFVKDGGSPQMGGWLNKYKEESYEDTKKRFIQYNDWLIYTGQICYSIIISCELLIFKKNLPKIDRWRMLRHFYLKDVPEELHFSNTCNLEFLTHKYPHLVYKIKPDIQDFYSESERSVMPNDESMEESLDELELRELEYVDPLIEQQLLNNEPASDLSVTSDRRYIEDTTRMGDGEPQKMIPGDTNNHIFIQSDEEEKVDLEKYPHDNYGLEEGGTDLTKSEEFQAIFAKFKNPSKVATLNAPKILPRMTEHIKSLLNDSAYTNIQSILNESNTLADSLPTQTYKLEATQASQKEQHDQEDKL